MDEGHLMFKSGVSLVFKKKGMYQPFAKQEDGKVVMSKNCGLSFRLSSPVTVA
jgi:hypothetical protein